MEGCSKDIFDNDVTREMLLDVAKGGPEAFNKFFYRKAPKVFNAFYLRVRSVQDAEDLSQLFWIKMWENRQRLIEVDMPGAYMMTIIVNMSVDFFEKQIRKLVTTEIEEADKKADEVDTISLYDFRKLWECIEHALMYLPDNVRIVFYLRFKDQLSYNDIHLYTGFKVSTVQDYYCQARAAVKKEIGKNFPSFTRVFTQMASSF